MIPFKRRIIYLLLIGFLPFVFVFSYVSIKQEELDTLGYELSSTLEDAIKKTSEERNNKLVKKQFAEADHHYIDNEIEKIPLLSQEIADLTKSLEQGFHSHEALIKQRLHQLTTLNVISFVESPMKKYKYFQETVETMTRPVEVDAKDLSVILSRIEGIQIGSITPLVSRPDLLISEFKLEKKKGVVFEIYSLQLKIIKREYN